MGGYRLAIVVSHPIQHFVSLYRALEEEEGVDVNVIFADRHGLESYHDDEMMTDVQWNMDLTGGYPHCFLSDTMRANPRPSRWQILANLADALASFEPDAVMVYGYTRSISWRALVWSRRRGRRVLMVSDSELIRKRSFARNIAKHLVVRMAFAGVDSFLSVGDRNEAYYRWYGVKDSQIFRSPFTIDETTFKSARLRKESARSTLRAELGLPQEAIIALFVGKLSERKRPQDLLRAVGLLQAEHSVTVHAVFAGNGALSTDLRAEAEASPNTSAHFLGFVNVDRLPSLYAASDMLVHPSEADPHPLVCSEAACVGLPVLLSESVGAEGPTDIARRGENARTFPAGDVAALADHILTLATQPSVLEGMSRRAVEIYDQLDVEQSVAGIMQALKSTTPTRRRLRPLFRTVWRRIMPGTD